MGRHGKNQTASAVYGYHEKKKDTASSGYGSKSVRMGKDSLHDFDCCNLTLQPCVNPVVTPCGYLYDKEAILECLLHQKRENSRKLKEYEKQKTKEEAELQELAEAETRSKLETFISTEGSIVSQQHTVQSTNVAPKIINNMDDNSDKPLSKQLPSFWVPSLTPVDDKSATLKKPDNKTYCPMSGEQLRVKDLIPIKFTLLHGEQESLIVRKARYICAVTHDVLCNSVPSAVLRPTGDVVTMECVNELIRKDMVCPISGIKLKESDIIPLVRGASGYAGTGLKLKAEKKGAVFMS